jgi:hypothetical protein
VPTHPAAGMIMSTICSAAACDTLQPCRCQLARDGCGMHVQLQPFGNWRGTAGSHLHGREPSGRLGALAGSMISFSHGQLSVQQSPFPPDRRPTATATATTYRQQCHTQCHAYERAPVHQQRLFSPTSAAQSKSAVRHRPPIGLHSLGMNRVPAVSS